MIEVEVRVKNAAEFLFSFEHQRFAARLGLREDSGELLSPSKDVVELVYAIDELSWSLDSAHKRLAIHLIALTWEHASPDLRENLRNFFVVCLSRVGVAPSTQMIDASFRTTGQYTEVGSFRTKLAAIALQLPTQQKIGELTYQLTDFQNRAYQSLQNNQLTGISAPTSAGKSFSINLAVVNAALRTNLPSVYIVPTISLVNQVCADLWKLLDAHSLRDWTVSHSYKESQKKTIYVLTQERAILGIESGLSKEQLSFLVIDEAQNLERVSMDDELRSKILFDFLHDMRGGALAERIVLSGPRLQNIGLAGSEIFGIHSAQEEAVESPVASITYSVERRPDGRCVLNQYRDALDSSASIEITNSDIVKGLESSSFTAEYYSYLNALVENLGDDSRNLLFAPTVDQARKIATELGGYQPNGDQKNILESLAEYLGNSIHPKHRLVDLVRRGVAFHSGGLPPHGRLVVEQAFSDGYIKDVVCTTTLMQGVNLPADVVFIRSPNLYVRKKSKGENHELSPYDFANLRGRAGRLLKDFVGRTVVLDETSFRDDAQTELFKDEYKSLRLTYQDIFNRNRDEVMAELASAGTAQSDGSRFLATFIRQTAFRHGDGAIEKFNNVGLSLGLKTLAEVRDSFRGLNLAAEVILANRYWDPFDLQRIKNAFDAPGVRKLSGSIWDLDWRGLAEVVGVQASVVPQYFKRLVGSAPSEKFVRYLATSAIGWGRETPLKGIIDDRKFEDDIEEAIDGQVDLIYKRIVYGLSAFLRPVASLEGDGKAILASLESGVYHPISQYLVSLGMFRETAVLLRRNYLGGIKGGDPDLINLVVDRVAGIRNKLDPWTLRQVDATIGRVTRS